VGDRIYRTVLRGTRISSPFGPVPLPAYVP
jgi:hypothetical protein